MLSWKKQKNQEGECEENATQTYLLTLETKSEIFQKERKICKSVHYWKDFREGF